MSIYGRPKTLGLNGITNKASGPALLHLMINLELSLQIAGSFLGGLCDPSTPIPPSQIAQQNDGDIVLVVTAIDGVDGSAVDLSPASALSILVKKPDLTTFQRAATLTTNGRDGRMQIALGPTDLDQAGYYFVQANFTIASVAKSTGLGTVHVSDNIVIEEP